MLILITELVELKNWWCNLLSALFGGIWCHF